MIIQRKQDLWKNSIAHWDILGYDYFMHAEIIFKGKVRKLRAKGKTYSEIMTELNVKLPKSTISDWCRGVSLPKWYQVKIDKLNKLS